LKALFCLVIKIRTKKFEKLFIFSYIDKII
jgi:hypothetical protein